MKISTEYYSKFENIEKSNKLVVDDIVDVHGIIYSDHDDLIIANIQDGVLKLRLLSYTFEELKTKISILSFAEYLPWWENCINIEINFQKTVLADPPLVLMFLTYDSKAWTSNFTIHLLSEQFKKVVELNINKRIGFIPWGIDETNGFGMSYKGIEKGNVWFTLEGALDILKECLDEALVYFQENSKFITENSLGTLFSFPSHLKTASIQYLIYFGQFLSDLGIEAETEIKEEAHKTLFTVHPKDKAESLLNIKNALKVFLNAPSNDVDMYNTNYGNLAEVQFKTTIMNLQANLMMMNSALQMKDATIQAKETTIQTQEINIQSLNLINYQLTGKVAEFEDKESENEMILNGIFELKKFETPIGNINIPEIARFLKRKI